MANDKEMEEKRLANANFLAAFDYVMERLGVSQKDLCKLLDTKSPYISFFRSGKYPVPDKTKYALIDLSVQKNIGQISIDYLDGYTDIMLLANIPDDELAEIKMRRTNPDYDAMQERKKKKEQQIEQVAHYIDPSSQQNASISAYIQLANRLDEDLKKKEIEMQERLAEKDTTIESQKAHIARLELSIADKEAIIKDRDARIVALERQLAAVTTSDIDRYPFAIGAADNGEYESKHI